MTCTCRVTPSARSSGASRTSSSTTVQPSSRPAASTISTRAVPGTRTVPNTMWSRVHGCVSWDTWPVNTHSSRSATGTAAARTGCATCVWPAAVTSPARVPAVSQNRSRWNAYVGRAVRRAPAWNGDQSTGTPATCASAREVANRRRPPSLRRSEPITATRSAAPCAAAVSSTAMASTGCGDASTKQPVPLSMRARTAGSNPTWPRRLPYQ